MHPSIITEDDLMAATEYTTRGRLESHLRDNHIPFFRGRDGRLWTTLGLIESARLKQDRQTPQPVEF